MQVATRRLIIVGIIALFSGTAGVTLGNFVARGPKISGLEELANFNSSLDMNSQQTHEAAHDPGFATRSGPNHYDCTGCDASLYNDVVGGDGSAGSTEPLPPYQADDAPVPFGGRSASEPAPRRGSPPVSAAPTALLASPASPGGTVGAVATPSLPQTATTQ